MALLGQVHPFFLHFAVALLLTAVLCDALGLALRREALLLTAALCDALGLVLRREALLHAGRWNTLLGTAATGLAVLSGLGAQASLEPHAAAGAPLLQLHKALGLLLLAVWVPVGAWRALSKVALPLKLRTLYLTFAFVGAAMVLVQSGLGSAMVYRHGVGLSASARMAPPPRPKPGDPSASRAP